MHCARLSVKTSALLDGFRQFSRSTKCHTQSGAKRENFFFLFFFFLNCSLKLLLQPEKPYKTDLKYPRSVTLHDTPPPHPHPHSPSPSLQCVQSLCPLSGNDAHSMWKQPFRRSQDIQPPKRLRLNLLYSYDLLTSKTNKQTNKNKPNAEMWYIWSQKVRWFRRQMHKHFLKDSNPRYDPDF